MYRPLADAIRPETLDEVFGQKHILGDNGLLRRIIESERIPNMVFYGPSGVGKTTVANIIAKKTNRRLHKLNATTAGIAEIREVIGELDTLVAPEGALLYLDEIQYFNKKQQQSLLEFIENGSITLIASTTDNPYFCVYNAVLSRCTVFEFRPLDKEDMLAVTDRALALASAAAGMEIDCAADIREHIAASCGGDARKAVNSVELLAASARKENGRLIVTMEDARELSQRSAMRYDRSGDEHYDILSALQKSIRGSDPDAALHYLARLLEAGDLLSPCRRLLVISSEDVGLGYPQAVSIVKACVDSALQLGLPEARLPLAEAALLLATAPKSNSVITSIEAAAADIRSGKSGPIPADLKDTHYSGAAKLGRGRGYKYPHDYENNYTPQQYLPDAIKSARYYTYGQNKAEQAAKAYWDAVKNPTNKED